MIVGVPRLTLLTTQGTALRVRQFASRHRRFSEPRWPDYPRVSLRPGQSATAPFVWQSNYCGHATASLLRVSWRGITITIGFKYGEAGQPPCNAPHAPSRIGVYLFQPSYAPVPAPPKQLPLRITITAPHSANPGQTVHYQVTLTNYAKHPVVLHRCPAYWQGLSTSADQATKVTHALILNCGPTPIIPPGGHATYAMRYALPTTAHPGANALVWTFEPVGTGAGGKTALRIT